MSSPLPPLSVRRHQFYALLKIWVEDEYQRLLAHGTQVLTPLALPGDENELLPWGVAAKDALMQSTVAGEPVPGGRLLPYAVWPARVGVVGARLSMAVGRPVDGLAGPGEEVDEDAPQQDFIIWAAFIREDGRWERDQIPVIILRTLHLGGNRKRKLQVEVLHWQPETGDYLRRLLKMMADLWPKQRGAINGWLREHGLDRLAGAEGQTASVAPAPPPDPPSDGQDDLPDARKMRNILDRTYNPSIMAEILKALPAAKEACDLADQNWQSHGLQFVASECTVEASNISRYLCAAIRIGVTQYHGTSLCGRPRQAKQPAKPTNISAKPTKQPAKPANDKPKPAIYTEDSGF